MAAQFLQLGEHWLACRKGGENLGPEVPGRTRPAQTCRKRSFSTGPTTAPQRCSTRWGRILASLIFSLSLYIQRECSRRLSTNQRSSALQLKCAAPSTQAPGAVPLTAENSRVTQRVREDGDPLHCEGSSPGRAARPTHGSTSRGRPASDLDPSTISVTG